MTNPKDWTEPTIPGFSSPSLPSTPTPNLSADHGTGALPTAQETEAACKALATNIEEALRSCEQIASYRIANRELSLTKTKLEEAMMWLEKSVFYVPAD
jgi:hypothetical protein